MLERVFSSVREHVRARDAEERAMSEAREPDAQGPSPIDLLRTRVAELETQNHALCARNAELEQRRNEALLQLQEMRVSLQAILDKRF